MYLQRFGEFCAATEFDVLPEDVVETAKVKLLDSVALALATIGLENRAVLARYLADGASDGPCAVVGFPQCYSARDAAFANGVLVHTILQDDADPESGHPACMVVPAAMAAADHAGASGQSLLTGIVLGFEMMWRGGGGRAVLNGASNRGIRGYVLNGSIAAAAAAGKCLGLDASQFASAMSCGLTFSSGLLEPIENGHMERSLMPGANARSGVDGALLARAGMRGTPTNLEGPNGYFRAFADLLEPPGGVLKGLGETFRIGSSATKLYPSGIANQAAIYTAQKAVHDHGVEPQHIAAIRIEQFPLFGDGLPAYPSVISQGPYTEVEQALPNKPFSVAAMLLNGRFDIHVLRDQLQDPAIETLAKKITSRGVAGIEPLQCEMDIDLDNGEAIHLSIDAASDPGFYPDLEGMVPRCHELLDRFFSESTVDALVESVGDIDTDGGIDRFRTALAKLVATDEAPA